MSLLDDVRAAIAAAHPAPKDYVIVRHSGRNGKRWRVLSSAGDQTVARERFGRHGARLRQGTLVLCHRDDIIASVSAARLRSRW